MQERLSLGLHLSGFGSQMYMKQMEGETAKWIIVLYILVKTSNLPVIFDRIM